MAPPSTRWLSRSRTTTLNTCLSWYPVIASL